MTDQEADALAKRIINCWHGGPPLNDWRDILQPLDHGRAGTTFVRLRNDREHAPSIKTFRDTYNALETTDGSIIKCRHCGDSGWLPCLNTYTVKGCVYTAAEPCSECANGRTATESTLWRTAPRRDRITDQEAQRLMNALAARHRPTKEKAA